MKESSEVSAFYADYFPMILFSHLRLRSESVPPEILTPELIKLEIKRIHELLAAGTILDAWKRVDSVAILVLFEVSSEESDRHGAHGIRVEPRCHTRPNHGFRGCFAAGRRYRACVRFAQRRDRRPARHRHGFYPHPRVHTGAGQMSPIRIQDHQPWCHGQSGCLPGATRSASLVALGWGCRNNCTDRGSSPPPA